MQIENEEDLIIPKKKPNEDPRRAIFMESDSEEEGLDELLASNLEDIHNPLKVILQRQFFELVTRSAYVRFQTDPNLPTLGDKLLHCLKNHCVPLTGKYHAKGQEDEVSSQIHFFQKNFKLAEQVFNDNDESLQEIFKFFSKKDRKTLAGTQDITWTYEDVVQFCKRCNLFDEEQNFTLSDLIQIIEKFYAPDCQLKPKLEKQTDLSPEDAKAITSKHMMQSRSQEIVYFEFKEILIEIALFLKEKIGTGLKIRSLLKKLISDWIAPNIDPFIKYGIKGNKKEAPRVWPVSDKERQIKVKIEEEKQKAQAQQKLISERKLQQVKIDQMDEEDTPALDQKEIEAILKQREEEEDAKRRAELEEEDDELDDDEDASEMQDDDY